MRRISAAAALLVVSCAPPKPQVPFEQLVGRAVLVHQLDSIARVWQKETQTAGMTVAVIKGRDTLLFESVGERDRERHLPAERNTVYRIGSMTKQFTAAAIMRLVEQKKISLDDPLTKYLPQYPQWSSVTIHELLEHTSGIHGFTLNPAWAQMWNQDVTPAQLVALVAQDTFDFAPGTMWRYNNTGYVLLGMVLERVTKKSYATVLQDWFFKPLKMQSAGACHALGYDLEDGALVPAKDLNMSNLYSAGGLCMSVPDFLRWQTALTSGKVVKPETYVRMTTPSAVAGRYGFGLFVDTLGGHRMIEHGGDMYGFSTSQLWLPEDTVRVVLFTNTLGSDPDFMSQNLAALAIGVPLKQKNRQPPVVAKYEGTYDIALPNGRTLTMAIVQDEDGLAAQLPGGKFPLTYIGNDTFGAAFDPTLRLTIAGTKLTLVQRGATMHGAKRP